MKDIVESMDKKELLLLTAAIATGIIHFYVGYSSNSSLLTLAGLGFIGGSGLFLSGKFRNIIVGASVPYTGVQFPLYYLYYGFSLGPLAGIDKLIQLAFIITGILYLRDNYRGSTKLKSILRK